MATNGTKPVWAGGEMRLDPYLLPQKTSYIHRSTQAQNPGDQQVGFTVDENGAVMRRRLQCGLPLSMALPSKAFRGVAARVYDNKDGSRTVTLELMHTDPELSVPLLVAATMDDIAADWHSWSRRFRLPMLVVDAEGRPHPVKQQIGQVDTQSPTPRRRRYFWIKHRPNFLRRRKSGTVGPVVTLTPAEIIARS